jgi:kynurenine formamidase
VHYTWDAGNEPVVEVESGDTFVLSTRDGHGGARGGDEEGFIPVHCYMFATTGTPILEVVNLEEIAAEGVGEFVFVGMPLPLRGATGSPLRPIEIPFAR